MSLIGSRVGMQHRCHIQRDQNTDTDDWGNQATADWQDHLTDQPCSAWTNNASEPVDEKTSVVIVDRRLSVELGTDVTETDRIGPNGVTDKAGNTIFEGPMDIEGVLRFADHLELILERVR